MSKRRLPPRTPRIRAELDVAFRHQADTEASLEAIASQITGLLQPVPAALGRALEQAFQHQAEVEIRLDSIKNHFSAPPELWDGMADPVPTKLQTLRVRFTREGLHVARLDDAHEFELASRLARILALLADGSLPGEEDGLVAFKPRAWLLSRLSEMEGGDGLRPAVHFQPQPTARRPAGGNERPHARCGIDRDTQEHRRTGAPSAAAAASCGGTGMMHHRVNEWDNLSTTSGLIW